MCGKRYEALVSQAAQMRTIDCVDCGAVLHWRRDGKATIESVEAV